ncbi:MAG: PAS domain S-box protein [Longimicrobiaceae bacterium]
MEKADRQDELSRRLLESVSDEAIFAVDPEGRVATWGAGAERVLGRRAEEVLERPFSALLAQDAGTEVLPRAILSAAAHGRYESEEEWVRGDGSRFRASLAVTLLHGEEGESLGYGAVVRDLSARVEAERALQHRSGLVRLLQVVATAANEADSVEDAVRTSLEEVCAYAGWSVGHAWLLAPSGELVSAGIWHLADPERFRAFRELSEGMRFAPGTGLPGEVLAAGQPVWVEELEGDVHFLRGQAQAVPVRAACALPVLVGREVVGVLEFFHDRPAAPDHALLEAMTHIGVQLGRVVERSRAREALRRSEARFAGIISISSDAIVSTDEEQRITLFNLGAE